MKQLSDEIGWILTTSDRYTDGDDLLTYHLLLGHPLRPTIFLVKTSTPNICKHSDDGDWGVVCFDANYLLWWQDSEQEEFNTETKKALKKLGAKVVSEEKVSGSTVKLYELKNTVKSGIIDDDIYKVLEESDDKAGIAANMQLRGSDIIWIEVNNDGE